MRGSKLRNKPLGLILIIAPCLFILKGAACGGFSPAEADYYQADPEVGHIHKPYARREYSFQEYGSGKIILKTNNLGFRKDSDTKVKKEKNTARILVAGDSQTDGVVNNNESFPNILETSLNSGHKNGRFEILNGGTGYYGFDQYYLFLKKYLYLGPDIYIVAVYVGNDFLDAARILEGSGEFNPRPAGYTGPLQGCKIDGITDQVMNQIFYFKYFPWMKEKTVKHAGDIILKIHKLCKARRIDLIVVFLPTKADTEWRTDNDRLNKAKECLGLSESDLNINRDLKDSLFKELSKNRIPYLDPCNAMRTQENEFYWKKDYHLNNKGHKFIADEIYKECAGIFNRLRAACLAVR